MPEEKSILIRGRRHAYAAVTVGTLRSLPTKPPRRFTRGLCVASLAAAGDQDAAATVGEMPFFGNDGYGRLVEAVIELHELERQNTGKAAAASESGEQSGGMNWPWMFHQLASAYHWTEAQIDALPVPQLWRYVEILSEEPSQTQLLSIIAQCMGWKKPEAAKAKPTGKKPTLYTGPKTNGDPSKFNAAAFGLGGMRPLDSMPAHIKASALQAIEKLKAEHAPANTKVLE